MRSKAIKNRPPPPAPPPPRIMINLDSQLAFAGLVMGIGLILLAFLVFV